MRLDDPIKPMTLGKWGLGYRATSSAIAWLSNADTAGS
jgi:hypothetical protein